jgi:hypothetical protein
LVLVASLIRIAWFKVCTWITLQHNLLTATFTFGVLGGIWFLVDQFR